MDTIAFRTRTSLLEDYQVVDIYINGFNLIEILRQVEQPFAFREGRPSLAGAYEGLPPLLVLPPSKHFWGGGNPHYTYEKGKISLLEYRFSGVPGDWPFVAQVEVDSQQVMWKEFEQKKRDGWDYKALGTFSFDLVQYRDALQQAKETSYR